MKPLTNAMATTGLLLTAALATPILNAQAVRFDDLLAGALSAGWTVGMTHKGGPPKWEILNDPSAPSPSKVLAQTSTDSTGSRFPFAIYGGATPKDGWVSVRFKAVAGKGDQAAGLVWRFRDADNYYLVRANALEDNVVLYKVEKGERISLVPKGKPSQTYGVKQTIPKLAWHTLKVDFHGTMFTVSLNGRQIMEVMDTTFAAAGKTGVWTKADSVTYFDDFQVMEQK